MTDSFSDEQLLEQFRKWLQETRRESAPSDGEPAPSGSPERRIGLDRLVEEFTALRHEIKLQTRSSRTLEERLESSLDALADAAATFRSAPIRDVAPSSTTEKAFATAIADLDEALDRGREQWEKNSVRLIGAPSGGLAPRLEEIHAAQTWWRRRLTAFYHREVCRQAEKREEQDRHERRSLFAALSAGYGLIQQRLARTMSDAGVVRIPTLGRPVDPEQMVVIEVVDAEGPAGQVVEEIRRGYTWRGQLLRPAEVRAIRPRFDSESGS